MMPKEKLYILDTSVILDDPLNIYRLYDHGQNVVVINDIVLSELNNRKDDMLSEAGYQARDFFRIADNEDGSPIELAKLPKKLKKIAAENEANSDDGYYKMILHFEHSLSNNGGSNCEIPLYIIYRKHYNAVGHESRNTANDLRIAEIANDYNLILVSNDISFKIASEVSGITAQSLKNSKVENPQNIDFSHTIFSLNGEDNFNKEELDTFLDFEQVTIKENYKSDDGNEYESGKIRYALNFNHHLEMLDFDDRFGKEYKGYVTPINSEQKFFYTLLTHPQSRICVASGATGSGKTLIALQAGLELVREGVVEGIVYARNTIVSNDRQAELGFRKGDQGQKLGYFMYPLYSAINFTIEQMQKRSVDATLNYSGDTTSIEKESNTERFMDENSIEVIDIAHLRGTTISKKFVILDEAQNMTNATMKLIGTRMGDGTRLCILGDTQQIDHPYLSKRRNALATMLQIAKGDNFIAGIQLRHTIRSKIADWFDKHL
jgi:PhoH-like ATPase